MITVSSILKNGPAAAVLAALAFVQKSTTDLTGALAVQALSRYIRNVLTIVGEREKDIITANGGKANAKGAWDFPMGEGQEIPPGLVKAQEEINSFHAEALEVPSHLTIPLKVTVTKESILEIVQKDMNNTLAGLVEIDGIPIT